MKHATVCTGINNMCRAQNLFRAIALGWMMYVTLGDASAQDPARSEPFGVTIAQGVEGKAFRALLRRFDDWAAIQKAYSAEQTKAFRARLIEKASELTGSDYERFLDDLHDRLEVLLSAEAREARDWLESMEAVSAPKKLEKIKSQLPDVARLTPSQLEEQLDEFDRRVRAQQQRYDAFNSDRSSSIDRARADRRRQEEASRAAREAASDAPANLGANEPVGPREKKHWSPRPPVYSRYAPYSPNVGRAYSPYVAPSLRGMYSPNLGGYRW
jgi:hypothetical protein